MNHEPIRSAVRTILEEIGEDSTRRGLDDTPSRVARMYEELTTGYSIDIPKLFRIFEDPEDVEYKGLVLAKQIPFYSMCEHHLVLFSGVAHVGYIPHAGKVVGLSKLARVVDAYARRLQMQERMTEQIATAIVENLSENCMVVIEAEHLCLAARGVQKPGVKTVTSAVRGDFLKEPEARAEFLSLIKE